MISVFATIPKPLFDRLAENSYCQFAFFRSIQNEIAELGSRPNPQPIYAKIRQFLSIPSTTERALFCVVDLAVHVSCYPLDDYDDVCEYNDDPPYLLDDLGDALLMEISRYYYSRREQPKAWYPGTYMERLQCANATRRRTCYKCNCRKHGPKCQWLPKTRSHVRKCHTNYVGRILANVICRRHLIHDLVKHVHSHIMSDEDIEPVAT